ncbi:hypothetical protein MHOL44478_05250 [Mycobacterium holsaticum DSM 44478]|nr:hypothetical protein [Mycolicibacterium holsaticum DSM 44478 = JCM 12374]
MLTSELDELLQRLVVVLLTGLAVLEALQKFLAGLLLVDRLVGKFVTVFQRVAETSVRPSFASCLSRVTVRCAYPGPGG